MWDGSILKNLGGKASILFQGKRVNRDIHGARNILIRFLTKVIEVLSPQGAQPLKHNQSRILWFWRFSVRVASRLNSIQKGLFADTQQLAPKLRDSTVVNCFLCQTRTSRFS